MEYISNSGQLEAIMAGIEDEAEQEKIKPGFYETTDGESVYIDESGEMIYLED